ncbi:uncharacterized protein LOC133785593 [Humulus lupulus]|uniref:uncharacterized protein LOC133785593 n=1 Tax=Humulus lupulus TaxID=3486 RepID=UPI002B4090A2|nr:uncharacterized protein LOC133785593 [Humulus lupulus]
MVDKVTQSRLMVRYARVLVDMEFSDHPPKSIAFINERDQLVEQLVEYEWLPSKCAACSQLGHVVANCNKENGVTWKEKSTVENGEKKDKKKVSTEVELQQPSGSVNLENRVDNPTNEIGSTVFVGNWITPKRRGSRQAVAAPYKTDAAPGKAISGWNVRGMNKREKQKAILGVCKENKVGFGALFETKVKHEKIHEVFENNFQNWDYFSSPIISGRILVFWQAKFVKVDILLEDPQLVHCKIRVCGQQKMFFATVVYGSNFMGERKKLWDKLASIGQLNNPWIIFGDFNAMFRFQDRNGGRQILAKDIADAQDWLALGQVEEFKCSGALYTWSNKHEVGDINFSKLDRAFTNDFWLDSFPKTEACFKWDCVSDHSYCVIKSQELNKVGFIPFHYCNHWLQYRGYREAVLQCWNSTLGSGGGLTKVVKKLFRVKHVLKRFNREEVGDVVLDYRVAKEEFCKAQEALAINPFDYYLHQAVSQAQQNFTDMQNRYASFLKQQSKINWVKFSDDNSRYFHVVMRKRRVENRITTFTLGDKIEDDYSKVVEEKFGF